MVHVEETVFEIGSKKLQPKKTSALRLKLNPDVMPKIRTCQRTPAASGRFTLRAPGGPKKEQHPETDCLWQRVKLTLTWPWVRSPHPSEHPNPH